MARPRKEPEAKISNRQLQALMTGRDGPVWRDIQLRTNRVLNKARTLAPVDAGRLRQSLTSEMRKEKYGPTGRVGTNLKYGLYVHEGTGIYGPRRRYIVPVKKKVLRWPKVNNAYRQTGGVRRYRRGKTDQYVFAMKVKGVKGRPFLRDALKAARGRQKV